MSESEDTPLDLSVVIPVYNEADAIGTVLDAWTRELDRLGIAYELAVYDDGSRDRTREVLDATAKQYPRLRVRTHANRGHGPTILRGYREARGDWVFQVDGDNEMAAEHFGRLWEARDGYDFVLGARQHRASPLPRRIISAASRATVWCLFGRGIWDVNSPYRLMRRSWLVKALERIPADTFAPNVILTGLAARDGIRLHQVWVPHEGRRTGTVSIVKWKLWKSAIRAFGQTLAVAARR